MRSGTPKPLFVLLVAVFLASPALAQLGSPVANWAAASTYTASHRGAITTMGDVTNPLPFVGVTPCRIVDTRGAAGTFGGPALAAGVPRSFPLPAGPCTGFPPFPRAYSLNITVTNTAGSGFILIYPQGGSQPLVSTLNYLTGQTIANAAIVSAGASGGVTVVAGVSGTDLIIDINGYYSETPGILSNSFVIRNNTTSVTMFVENQSTSCSDECALSARTGSGWAILGLSSGNGAGDAGIVGSSNGVSGTHYGVRGSLATTASGSAAVYGVDATGDPGAGASGLTAGVYGASQTGFGVLGTSRQAGYAVKGASLDSGGSQASVGYLGYSNTTAVYAVGNLGATGVKSFIDPHPQDASLAIAYVALEGPEAGTYFRGTSAIQRGRATIVVPETFRLVSADEGLTVQITPIGAFAEVYIESQDLNQIVVRGSKDVRFHYLVNGIRRAFADYNPVVPNEFFRPETAASRMATSLAPDQRRLLVANGTYNEDGSVNLTTAERLGWTARWAEVEAAARAEAQRRSAAERSRN